MREKLFERKIRQFLNYKGCWNVKYFGNAYSQSGVPDILACVAGQFVAIEVKGEGGKPSELQELNIKRIRKSGGIAMVLYPKDWEAFKAGIEDMLRHDSGYGARD